MDAKPSKVCLFGKLKRNELQIIVAKSYHGDAVLKSRDASNRSFERCRPGAFQAKDSQHWDPLARFCEIFLPVSAVRSHQISNSDVACRDSAAVSADDRSMIVGEGLELPLSIHDGYIAGENL